MWAQSQAPGSAWGRVTIPGSDGRLRLSDALRAFALAVGPVPGVSPPRGALTPIFSADLAIDTVLADFPQLSGGERHAVLAALGKQGPHSAAKSPRPVPTASAGAQPAITCPGADSSNAGAYRRQVAGLESSIGTRTGIPFTVPVTIVVADARTIPDAALADSEPCSISADGSLVGCAIRVRPASAKVSLGGDLTSEDRRAVVAHELTHCLLYQVLGTGYDATPAWYLEGAPTWVMATLAPDPIALAIWHRYLATPGLGLPGRAYTAVGFWAHLQESGSDVFHDIGPVGHALLAGGDGTAAGWDAVSPSSTFLDTWGSGYAGGRYPGRAWLTSGTGLPLYRASFETRGVSNGGSLDVDVNAYASAFDVLEVASDVVRISAGAHTYGMVSLGGGRTSVLAPGRTVELCTEDGGCDHCPAGESVPAGELPEMDAGREYLGITGGHDAGSATVVGMSFADFCAGGGS